MLNNSNAVFFKSRYIAKLPAKYNSFVFSFFMSSIMAFLMCMVITAANHNLTAAYLTNDFMVQVAHAYKLAMPVAFICILIVRPVVIKLVAMCVMK